MCLTWQIAVVLLVIFTEQDVQGLALNLTGPDKAVLNESYTFHCQASPADEVQGPFSFTRKGTAVCTVLSDCRLLGVVPGYPCGCAGDGEATRIYNMTIINVTLTDEADWTCKQIDDISNSFHLTVLSPVNNVSIEISGSMSDSVNITEGNPSVFSCVIQGAKPAPSVSQVTWYREVSPGNNESLPGIPGNTTTSDRTTSINLTYTARRQDQGQKVFCAATNSLMVNRSVPAVSSAVGTATIVCTGGAFRGEKATLVCKITNPIVGGMRIIRPNSGTQQQVIQCNTSNTKCILRDGVTGYSYVTDSSSQTTLTIHSFNPSTDEGEWICRDGLTGIGEATCNMSLFYEAILEIDPCPSNWFDGVPLNVTCVLKDGAIGGSMFISKNNQPNVQCNSTFGDCFSFDPGRYDVVGVPSVSVTMLIKSFEKGRDDTEWICIDFTHVPAPPSCKITLSAPYGVKGENVTTLTKVTLPFSVSVTGSCTYLLPDCTWIRKIQGESEERVPDNLTSITNTNTSCNSGDQQATCTFKFDYDSVPAGFVGKHVSLRVSITHASLIGNSTPIEIVNSGVIFTVGPDTITLIPSPPAEMREGSKVIVNCTSDCLPRCSFSWTWGKESISSTSSLILENIGKKQAGAYMCTVTNTISLISRNKTFHLSFPDDPERMSSLSAGAISGIVIAVVLAFAIPTVWILYKRNKRQPDAVEENTDNRTQKSEIERSQIDNPAFTKPE
ncbi:uncharacterized protein LOC121386620 isoform X2 [Gigantopelta aegis]|uniref:uncharacterized protein LOC121386620 isoform X2 n=1 Tax=Gigantopelta aegis TaxID=1735272 RepID=UPI001B88C046|nr:uncharacterized protein LOC121386620 isoform X2 [Gigantopelta aegis]